MSDIASIVRYISKDNLGAAVRVKAAVEKKCSDLKRLPLRGRKGVAEGTREIVFAPWPYIAVYRVLEDEVQILRVRHAAQDWP